MIQLRDVIHYFIGQKCFYDDPYYNSFGVSGKITTRIILEVREPNLSGAVTNVKPLLRPLSSMTEEQVKEFIDWDKLNALYVDVSLKKEQSGIMIDYAIDAGEEGVYCQSHRISFNELTPLQFHFLISKGYDLFSLIESGQALDISTLNKTEEK